MSSEKPTFIIGDVHGHLDRLEALLRKAGIIGDCPECNGMGSHENMEECVRCQGDAVARINHDVTVVQVGDLGHFGSDYVQGQGIVPSSSTADYLCYSFVPGWIDVLLWGNHDRAVFFDRHRFNGFIPAPPETKHFMKLLKADGTYKAAYAAHGRLITHAGLHKAFKNQNVEFNKTDPYAVAEYINKLDEKLWTGVVDPHTAVVDAQWEEPDRNIGIIEALSAVRGGMDPVGGILWRDKSEKLYDAFPQVFGHSADKQGLIRRFNERAVDVDGKHWCVDIGGKNEKRLAGLWLPSEEIVRIDL